MAYIAIAAIIAWAIVSVQSIRAKSGAPSAEVEARVRELAEALERSEAERERLAERVQNLEAIVTTETYDLLRDDPEQAAPRLELPDEVAEASPEERAAQLARRMRS